MEDGLNKCLTELNSLSSSSDNDKKSSDKSYPQIEIIITLNRYPLERCHQVTFKTLHYNSKAFAAQNQWMLLSMNVLFMRRLSNLMTFSIGCWVLSVVASFYGVQRKKGSRQPLKLVWQLKMVFCQK